MIKRLSKFSFQSFEKDKGFTLIELLVVIAIVGLLASITLVAIKKAGEKAKWARMLQFSSSLYHALGAGLVGEWRFEEGANGTCADGKDVCDTSGYENNGEWNGTGTHWADNDVSELGTAGQFNGSNDYIEILDSGTLDGMNELTIQLWFRIDNLSSNQIQWQLEKERSYSLGYISQSASVGDNQSIFLVWIEGCNCYHRLRVDLPDTLKVGRWYQ
ncbi:unnamed protein product, partial [marine sediment metagenome]